MVIEFKNVFKDYKTMKTLIISGGAEGIGLATVKQFQAAGYFCCILDIQKPSIELENTQFFECDVANINAIQETIKKISLQQASIDALVCNAGVHFSANLHETTFEEFERVMNINFRGAFFLTHSVLPIMTVQKHGAIVFVGSDQTLIAKPRSAIYAASKAALGSLAKSTAIDYAHLGIRSNLVAPGTIDTPLYQNAVYRYCQKENVESKLAHAMEAQAQPLGRIGQPDEVAHLIYFLCSDKASFITGGVYSIDGGYTAK
jgi:NAD(P)-dependent dehydrogenase (short-subunit alcohol dehydrogenase family)